MSNKAVFLDRDGVINIDHGYVSTVDDFEFIDGVIEACRAIKAKGYKLVVITNQSGIARGYFSEDEFLQLTEWMDWSLADRGVDLDGIYYCPHHPTKGKGDYLQDCQCRKPNPGMINTAAQFLKLDLSKSYLVGDKESDLQAGIRAGIGSNILVTTGQSISQGTRQLATHVVDSLDGVVELLQ